MLEPHKTSNGGVEAAARTLSAFRGREAYVALLDGDRQPQLEFYGRLARAIQADEQGGVVALEFEALGGGHAVGRITLDDDASIEWRDVALRFTAGNACEPAPVGGLVICLGDGREAALCRL